MNLIVPPPLIYLQHHSDDLIASQGEKSLNVRVRANIPFAPNTKQRQSVFNKETSLSVWHDAKLGVSARELTATVADSSPILSTAMTAKHLFSNYVLSTSLAITHNKIYQIVQKFSIPSTTKAILVAKRTNRSSPTSLAISFASVN